MRCTVWFSRAVVGAVMGFGLLACRSTPSTAIRLEIVSDVESSIEQLHVRTYDTVSFATLGQTDIPVAGASAFPVSLSIVPRDSQAPNQRFGVEVTADLSSGTIMQRVVTGFDPGHIRILQVDLLGGCTGVACDSRSTCDATGGCVLVPTVDPQTLPEFGADGASNADTVSPADTGTLDGGTDSAVDAGMDGGTPDVGTDTGTPDLGTDTGVADVGTDTGLGVHCPGSSGRSCPVAYVCRGAPPSCCLLASPPVRSCALMSCPPDHACIIDMMGNAACCGPPQ